MKTKKLTALDCAVYQFAIEVINDLRLVHRLPVQIPRKGINYKFRQATHGFTGKGVGYQETTIARTDIDIIGYSGTNALMCDFIQHEKFGWVPLQGQCLIDLVLHDISCELNEYGKLSVAVEKQ